MSNKEKLTQGIGVNDYEGKVEINGKVIRSYNTWYQMLVRCYSEKCQKKQPTYVGCSVSEEWLSFSNFKKWFDTNYRYDLVELGLRIELDKDLLVEGNKIYSSENCLFLPKNVNLFLANKQSSNGSGRTGVSFCKVTNKWRVRINDFGTGKNKHLGYFTDVDLASQAYLKARELEIIKVKQYLIDLGYERKVVDKIK